MNYSRQRKAIVDYLLSVKTHPTAEEIYESVRKVYPKISLGTVYRNLGLLEEIGALRRLKTGVMDRYDGDLTPHAHFVCSTCGQVSDLPQKGVTCEEIPCGFTVERIELFCYGTCATCNKSKN